MELRTSLALREVMRKKAQVYSNSEDQEKARLADFVAILLDDVQTLLNLPEEID